jgi:DNA modification methylase
MRSLQSSSKLLKEARLMQKIIYKNKLGKVVNADSCEYLQKNIKSDSVDLIVTSPPFALTREKNYGNVKNDEYCAWLKPFIKQFKRIIKPSGSIVIDIGGVWNKGLPTKSIYQYKLLIMMVEELGLHLIHDYFWWNPSKLPTPAEWVTVRRIRVKDAVNNIFWLAKTPYPKSSNKRVLSPYSKSMEKLLSNGYKPRKRPSGHDISNKFQINNKGAIPPNLLAVANTSSSDPYVKYCKEKDIKIHDARFPRQIPEYFIRLTTNENDMVVDPFCGSGITAKVASDLKRKWLCIDLKKDYCEGSKGWFQDDAKSKKLRKAREYKIYSPLYESQDVDDFEIELNGGNKKKKGHG